MEEDESLANSFVHDFEAARYPEHNHTQLMGKSQKARFINALAGGDNDWESGGLGLETEEDLDEEVDIDVSSGDSSEDELEDEADELPQPVK